MSFLSNGLQTTGLLLLTPSISVHFREVGDELGQIGGPERRSHTGRLLSEGRVDVYRVLRKWGALFQPDPYLMGLFAVRCSLAGHPLGWQGIHLMPFALESFANVKGLGPIKVCN